MTPTPVYPDLTAECIDWHGYRNRAGYGVTNRGSSREAPRLAHRVVWAECFGPIPDGAQIDHLCENPGCINPVHLALRRSDGEHKQAHAARRTRCRCGHSYAEHGRVNSRGGRYCRACERENERRRLAIPASRWRIA